MMALTRDRLLRPFYQVTVSLFLCGTLLGVSVHLWSSWQATREAAYEQLEFALHLEEERVREWIKSRRSDALFLAQMDEIRHLVQAAQDKQSALNTEEIQHTEEIDDAALRLLLSSFLESRPDLRELQVLSNLDGEVVFSNLAENQGTYRTRDRFFQEGRLSLWIQAAYISPQSLKTTITLATPLGGTRRLGVLVLHLDPTRLTLAAPWGTGPDRSGEIYLIDEYGGLVTPSTIPKADLVTSASEGIKDAFLQESSRKTYENLQGVTVLGVNRRLPDLKLALLGEIQQSELYAKERPHQVRATIFALLMSLLFLGVTWGAFGRVADRLFDDR